MSKTITTISLYGDISYKNNNNNHNAYVYLQLKKRCLIQKNQSLSSISSNPKNLHNIISILDTTSNKGLLATVVSSDGVKVFKIQDANIVKKDGIRTIRLTTSNKELHSKDNYAKNVTQIFDDNVLRSASVLIYTFSLVNNTPLNDGDNVERKLIGKIESKYCRFLYDNAHQQYTSSMDINFDDEA